MFINVFKLLFNFYWFIISIIIFHMCISYKLLLYIYMCVCMFVCTLQERRWIKYWLSPGDCSSLSSRADTDSPGHSQRSRIQSPRQEVSGPPHEIYMERYLSPRGISELWRDSGVLLGYHSNHRSDCRSFTPVAHGGMVPLQCNEDAGVRDYRSASGDRDHNRLLPQCGIGHPGHGFNHGRLLSTGNLGAKYHLDR